MISNLVFLSSFDDKMEGFAEKVRNLIYGGIRVLEDGLGITASEMLIQLCATLILFLAVRFLLWNKVTALLDKRKEVVRNVVKERDDALAQANKVKAECDENIALSKVEATRIIEKAKQKSYIEAENIIKQADETAKLKIKTAEEEINMMVTESQNDIKREIVEVAYQMASKIVEKEVSKESHDLNVEDFIDKGLKDGKCS